MSTFNTPETSFAPYQQNTSGNKKTAIIVAAIVVFLVAALAVFAVLRLTHTETNPSPTPTASGELSQDTGISLGKDLKAGTKNEGATQVDIYFDYSCTHCNHLDRDYGAKLGEAAKNGDITLVYHPVAIMGVLFSYTGAGAEFFVAENEPDKYFAFHGLLHEKLMTPYLEGTIDSPRAQDIVNVAKEAGVSEENCAALLKELQEMEDILLKGDQSRSTDLLDQLVDASNKFVNNSQKMHGSAGTPTVYIDNVKAENWTKDIPNLLNK